MTLEEFYPGQIRTIQEPDFEDTMSSYKSPHCIIYSKSSSKKQADFESTGLKDVSEPAFAKFLNRNPERLQNFLCYLLESENTTVSQSSTNMSFDEFIEEFSKPLSILSSYKKPLIEQMSLFEGYKLELTEKEAKKLVKDLKKGSSKKSRKFIEESMTFYEEMEKRKKLYKQGKLF